MNELHCGSAEVPGASMFVCFGHDSRLTVRNRIRVHPLSFRDDDIDSVHYD